jgi:hypothetical protein
MCLFFGGVFDFVCDFAIGVQHRMEGLSVYPYRCCSAKKSPHKVLTYVEYRAVSGVFQNIDPPPPLHPASVSSPRTKGGGVHTHRAGGGGWGVNILEDARHWILASYSI